MILLVFIMGLTLCFSCEQTTERQNNSVAATVNDTLQKSIAQREKERQEKRKVIEDQERIDSLRLDSVLMEALDISAQNIDKNIFYTFYEVKFANEDIVKVEIDLDHHLTRQSPHLIIRRYGLGEVNIDIYARRNNQFEKAVSHEQWALTFVNDTTQDINGDGLKDFVVNWYGSTGCCLKAFSNVYLQRQNRRTFSKEFQFINPTFSPSEKIIRGVSYGHPGHTSMYKYRWKGEAVDTLEYIYFEENDKDEKTGKVIRERHQSHSMNRKRLNRLDSIPTEYKNIEGFDWFKGDF
jgi:hypothetical protein